MLIAIGIDPVTTANELGHADANTTNAIYAHQVARAGVFSILKETKISPLQSFYALQRAFLHHF